jgi:hypothetical protein
MSTKDRNLRPPFGSEFFESRITPFPDEAKQYER